MEPLSGVFEILNFETILPSVFLTRWGIFMGGGTAGGLWRHQQWSPSWILPRIRTQVKTGTNGDFFVLDMKNNT